VPDYLQISEHLKTKINLRNIKRSSLYFTDNKMGLHSKDQSVYAAWGIMVVYYTSNRKHTNTYTRRTVLVIIWRYTYKVVQI